MHAWSHHQGQVHQLLTDTELRYWQKDASIRTPICTQYVLYSEQIPSASVFDSMATCSSLYTVVNVDGFFFFVFTCIVLSVSYQTKLYATD